MNCQRASQRARFSPVAHALPPAEAVFEGAPDGMLLVNDEGQIVAMNSRLAELLQTTRQALVGTSLYLLARPELRVAQQRWATDWFAAPRVVEPVMGEWVTGEASVVPVEITVAPLLYEGRTWAIAQVRKTTERRRLDAHQVFLAVHDALTGVANRAAFEDAVAQLSANGPWPISVVMVDLDGLKQLNDQHGHRAGDEQLRAAASVLRRACRASDLVARIGGDEFSVLVSNCDEVSLQALEARLSAALDLHNETAPVKLAWSVGSAVARADDSLRTVLQTADARMYTVKQRHHALR